MPKFSIIVPVYNVESYLDECVQSVLDQTCTDFEIILVDDGSTDNSGAVCDKWARSDSRISVVHKQNGGLSSARNEGLRHITGQYVLFLDSDDYWISCDVLDTLMERLSLTKADVLIYNLQKVFDGKMVEPYFKAGMVMPHDLNDSETVAFAHEKDLWTACACNKVIRAELFADGQLRFVEGITSEDIDWCARLLCRLSRIDYLDICVLAYRQRVSSITGNISWSKISCLYNNFLTCVELTGKAEQEKSDLLKAYTAYQYGTLLYNVATYPACPEKREMIKQTKSVAYVLDWSTEPKISLIRRVRKLVGFDMTLYMLFVRSKVSSILQKRSD